MTTWSVPLRPVTSWLDPLRAALDASDSPVRFFFRDNDAGWDDDALAGLLDAVEADGVPLDVAVIPTATTEATAHLLQSRAGVQVHQHGDAHVNHEPAGHRCEFGVSRTAEQQYDDIALGRAILRNLFDDLPPVFTPPWNRTAPWTPSVVRDLGFAVLSRDVSAGRADEPGLAELPVTVDWCGKRKKVPVGRESRGLLLAESAASGGPVGVMLRHAVLSDEDRRDVADLLGLVSVHPAARAEHLADGSLTTAP